MHKLLITGGSGLLALNWAIAVQERLSVLLGLHRRIVFLPSVESQHIDLESADRLTTQFETAQATIVIHAAALTNIEQCEANQDLAWHVNVVTAENVAKACNRLGILLVHISSDHLFSGEGSMAMEETSSSPINVYGRTKVEAEMRVLEICPTALVVRTNFYGWGTSYRRSFSDVIIDALRQQRPITLFEDVYYTPILIQDLVDAVHGLIDQKAVGVFNIVGNERLSKYQFGLRVADAFGLDARLIRSGNLSDVSNLVQRPRDMSLSNSKVCAAIGKEMGSLGRQLEKLREQELQGLAKELKSL
jgi:dTDP-4-dehydrorhamnose reductase